MIMTHILSKTFPYVSARNLRLSLGVGDMVWFYYFFAYMIPLMIIVLVVLFLVFMAGASYAFDLKYSSLDPTGSKTKMFFQIAYFYWLFVIPVFGAFDIFETTFSKKRTLL